jgi:hypothetical protein
MTRETSSTTFVLLVAVVWLICWTKLALCAAPPLPPPANVTAMPAAVRLSAPPDFPDRTSVTAFITPSEPAPRYRIYFGIAPGRYTNSVTSTKTNIIVGPLVDGTRYYFAATSVDAAGVDSAFSIERSIDLDFSGQLVHRIWEYRTRGRAGATNDIQVSTNLVNWTTIKTFLGTGAITGALRTNNVAEFFRTVAR